MLGSLARKLRILGFDTSYFREGPDSELLNIAEQQGRVILTSDRGLATVASLKGWGTFLIKGSNDLARLKILVQQSQAASIRLKPGESRCALCNGDLMIAKKSQLGSRVPKAVVRRHRLFYQCRDCGKVYWKGGHWSRLRLLSRGMKLARSRTFLSRDDHNAVVPE